MSRLPVRSAARTPSTADSADVDTSPSPSPSPVVVPAPAPRIGSHRAVVSGRSRLRVSSGVGQSAACLAVATAGALLINVLAAGQPAAQAQAAEQRISVAQQLSLTAAAAAPAGTDVTDRLADQVASRSEREAAATAAATQQAAADQAVRDAQAAAGAAAAAEAKAVADAAAAAATPASFQDYALQQLGGDAGEFGCLENLWGKESGWNPDAQNRSSTAYGIPQFLNSTWALTGIAKTSDGYRQIDAGLIYIDRVYGSPCKAWGHSQSTNWY